MKYIEPILSFLVVFLLTAAMLVTMVRIDALKSDVHAIQEAADSVASERADILRQREQRSNAIVQQYGGDCNDA